MLYYTLYEFIANSVVTVSYEGSECPEADIYFWTEHNLSNDGNRLRIIYEHYPHLEKEPKKEGVLTELLYVKDSKGNIVWGNLDETYKEYELFTNLVFEENSTLFREQIETINRIRKLNLLNIGV